MDISKLNIKLKGSDQEVLKVCFEGCSVLVQLYFHGGRPVVRLDQYDERDGYVTGTYLELKSNTKFEPCYEDVSMTPEFNEDGWF
jgi:hypothetical protein